MSGGHFDYMQYRIRDIADSIQEAIDNNKVKPEWWCGEWNGQRYSDATIVEFKKGIDYLRMAEIYADRIDLLLSEDDGEGDFHENLKRDFQKYNRSKVIK